MCTVIILRRPDHPWPVLIAANRDEMTGRPWSGPARHWDDRSHVVAGQDLEAGGTWLALNDDGVAAAILNRHGSLGPLTGKRSRGELPLEAVDHAEARVAAEALGQLEPASYRTFNMVVADALEAFWVRSDGADVSVHEIPEGLSMISSSDLNDTNQSDRMRHFLPLFRAAPEPDAETGDWSDWEALLASTEREPGADHGGAMNIETNFGFATVSSSLIALPAKERYTTIPIWRFCPGRPGEHPYASVDLS